METEVKCSKWKVQYVPQKNSTSITGYSSFLLQMYISSKYQLLVLTLKKQITDVLGHIKHNLLFLCFSTDGKCWEYDKNSPAICKPKGSVVYIAKNVCVHSL